MSCGGRGSRTLVLLTYYRNFDTCVGADQTTGRAFHHQVCCLTWKSIGDRDLYVPSQVTREAHYAAASICARGVILTTLAFICFAISKHDCLHDSLPSISNQNQNTPKRRARLASNGKHLKLMIYVVSAPPCKPIRAPMINYFAWPSSSPCGDSAWPLRYLCNTCRTRRRFHAPS